MPTSAEAAREIQAAVLAAIERAVKENHCDTTARKPPHRVKFHWPPHPVSYDYHVLASDWSGRTEFKAHGTTFQVEVARTPYGVFGRCSEIWNEAMGDTEDDMLENLRLSSESLFRRQVQVNRARGQEGRYLGKIRDLPPTDLVQLLFADDRDIANDARIEIEAHASSRVFYEALLEILLDRRHPNRRSAQWCVLDLFEDLPSFAVNPEQEERAIRVIRDLIWDAEDDYARTIYKAGVVLGGHVTNRLGGEMLLECLDAPSKYGRRSAIHGLFHVAEWQPDLTQHVVTSLRAHADAEEDAFLGDFARLMARDIEAGNSDHVAEPVFPEEQA